MPKDPIDSLAALASESGLTLLLIGAHALQELGVARQTFDLDLLIAETDKDALATLIESEGYGSVAETENFQRFSHPAAERMDVDVLFVDPSTFEKLDADSAPAKVGASALRIPSPAHFIALKLHAIRNDPKREARDLGDITELLRARSEALAPEELEEICRAHGPQGVYSKLKVLL